VENNAGAVLQGGGGDDGGGAPGEKGCKAGSAGVVFFGGDVAGY